MLWTLKPTPNQITVKELQHSLNVPEIIAHLLVQRGIKSFEEAKCFFRPQLSDLHSPWLMKNMNAAVDRILTAVQNHENIMIYGDYDVDGTTSVSLVYDYLKKKT